MSSNIDFRFTTMKKALPIIGLALICFVACKNKKQVTTDTSAKEVEQKSSAFPSEEKSMMTLSKGANILEKHWKAVEIMGKKVEEIEGTKQAPYITLKSNGDIIAHGGCNSIFGRYEFGMKNFIVFNELSQTEMACEFANYDSDFIEALTLARQYAQTGEDQLQIIVGKRAPLAVFVATYPKEGK